VSALKVGVGSGTDKACIAVKELLFLQIHDCVFVVVAFVVVGDDLAFT
jgi:hypothetical protein